MSAKFLIICLSLAFVAIQVQGFVQVFSVEVEEKDGDGNVRVTKTSFHGPVRNFSEHVFAYDRSKVKQICYQGYWNLYADGNFSDWDNKVHAAELTCTTYKYYFQGLRSGGARETNIDAISLYGPEFYLGEESYTEGPAFGGISAQSYIITGRSSWTLFNGSNFEEPSYCQKQTNMQGLYDWQEVSWGNKGISQVGSVLKGCFSKSELAKQVQLYKK